MLVENFVEAADGVEVRVTIEVKGGDRTEILATGYEKPVAVLGVTEQELGLQAHTTANAVLGLHQNQGRNAVPSGYQTEGDILPPGVSDYQSVASGLSYREWVELGRPQTMADVVEKIREFYGDNGHPKTSCGNCQKGYGHRGNCK